MTRGPRHPAMFETLPMTSGPETAPEPVAKRERVVHQMGAFVSAVRRGDEAMVEETVLRLTSHRRILRPLSIAVGGLAMLFTGVKLLFSNWRLLLVQALPAMWIWLVMFDLKAHALHGKSFHVLKGPILIPLVLVVVAITAASFYLNAIFAFSIIQPGTPEIRPGVAQARLHRKAIIWPGVVVGLLLGFATLIVTRWGRPWFGISMSIVIAILMTAYVAIPSRLIGVKPSPSRRDKLSATAVGGAVGAVVCTPPYVLGRVGILMLGSHVLRIPGFVVIAVAALLQAGATGAVKTVKMSAKLVGTHERPQP